MNKLILRGLSLTLLLALLTIVLFAPHACAQIPITNDPPFYGPYNAVLLSGGAGLKKTLVEHDTVLRADSSWTMYCWVRMESIPSAASLIAGLGETAEEYPRYLGVDSGKFIYWMGEDNSLASSALLTVAKWQFLAVTFDGTTFRLFSDGKEVASGKLTLGRVSPALYIAPSLPPPQSGQHFGGRIAGLTLLRKSLTTDELQRVSQSAPDFAALNFEEGSKPWPLQTRGQAGYRAPQDPTTLPRSKAPYSAPRSTPVKASGGLNASGDNTWTIGDWKLAPAPTVKAEASEIATHGFPTEGWWPATVPGTVLTTMVDRGVYPDPDYGLNNLAIPESLNKQDYWYRSEFKVPQSLSKRQLTLTFEGINYEATVWLNGSRVGSVKGAFRRGAFDVTNILRPGETNVLAVRISPPPHPGIPHEQSILGGAGENGGAMCLDGPTFVATEGWDWVPAVRDRDTGLWQPVVLSASGAVRIGDTQVVTQLPLPDTTRAVVEINVPIENLSDKAVHGTLMASFDQVAVSKDITAPPGASTVKLAAAEFPQLNVDKPRLWWPNGYGKPELYELKVTFTEGGGQESDTKKTRFGIREITYELSLLDSAGNLRRVEVSPTAARAMNQLPVVDVSHNGMRQIAYTDTAPPPEWMKEPHQWAASLAPGAENSLGVKKVDDTRAAPYLVLKVNGVRIAARGGNWGMDDSRKRVSRERLEPYFRLHRDANLNIIRNWVGQDTEEAFFDLADEYGLLVWNDFWDSTEDYNIEPQDPALFLDNARDTILRFRNHPSIAVWCGRNEGVPQPIINQGLEQLTTLLDGTRYYSPSSNQVNLQNSGPYKYQDPKPYFTTLNHGFSVETGTASLSTLESLKAWIAPADQWPISDAWAYHDWHQSGNGDVAPFMAELEAEFGAGTSLEDFERKAQMLNYVNYRAIFEGMNAHLWAPNSGRMLWMTQPAWPSNMWQILSSDYDTQASFYGTKKACEPLHVQLDPSDFSVTVVNTTTVPQPGLLVTANVYSLENKLLLHHEERKDAAANAATAGFKLALDPFLAKDTDLVLMKLEVRSADGQVISDNLYWLGEESSSYRRLNRLPAAQISASATYSVETGNGHVHLRLQNNGSTAALANKATLVNAADGLRILPAYFSDNYVSLLPGETRDIEIEYPAKAAKGAPQVSLRGWNLEPRTVSVALQK
jgi:hypothetical protein